MKFIEKKLPIIISILAILLSIFTYFQSRKDFNTLNRPQLVIKPIKYDDDSYLKFSTDSLSYTIKILIEIKNNGMTTAQDVKFQLKGILDLVDNESEFIIQDSTLISIPPGGEIKFEPSLSFRFKNEEALKSYINNINKYLETDYIEISWPITYRSSYKKETLYKVFFEYKINKHEAYVIKYLNW